MQYVEAPNYVDQKYPISVFFAGTITGAEDWQAELLKKIGGLDITVYNPRRKNFDVKDPNASGIQIKWEFDMLRQASFISFWFAPETLGPIVLFEYGAWTMADKPLAVGVHPKYPRKQDVEIQTKLVRPNQNIVYDLDALAEQITYQYNFFR